MRKLPLLFLSFAACGEPDGLIQGTEQQLTSISLQITHVDNGHRVMAVTPDGTIYALQPSAGSSRLYASTDKGTTWSQRTKLADSRIFKVMTVLPSGTLLADTADIAGSHDVFRSTDGGRTWTKVLHLGDWKWLQPHNVRELDGTVYMGLYQTFAKLANIPLYVSKDDGVTWSIRYTFTGRRHCHSLLADPTNHVLWAFLGDPTGGVMRSTDKGFTWTTIANYGKAVGVDGIVTSTGVMYGTDDVYDTSITNSIMSLTTGGTEKTLKSLPGPSYSILHLAGGGYLLGETREPTDPSAPSVYSDTDTFARIYGSPDGITWTRLYSFSWIDHADYARADVYWQLPSGEAVIEVHDASGHGVTGTTGFLLVKAVLQ